MLAKIRNILIITNTKDVKFFSNLLGNGNDLGIKITYIDQKRPNGLPEAFIVGENFIKKNNVALILGDNFFYGQGFTHRLEKYKELSFGAKVFLYTVNNPQDYGVAEVKNDKIVNITEKPKKPKTNHAITGLYFFDNKVVEYAKRLKPSKRNELEIIDLLKIYQKKIIYHLILLVEAALGLIQELQKIYYRHQSLFLQLKIDKD